MVVSSPAPRRIAASLPRAEPAQSNGARMPRKTARSTTRRSPAARGAKPTTRKEKVRNPASAPRRKTAGPKTPARAKTAGRKAPAGRRAGASTTTGVALKPRNAAAARTSRNAGVSDDAVQAGSGRTWAEWFELLDAAGADRWKHKDIAAFLYDELECPGWWNQMVAVGYEQARGLRAANETSSGFQVSCSRTIAAPVAAAYAAWAEEPQRRRWLGAVSIAVRKSTPQKTMRITWADGVSSVEVYFFAKGAKRSLVNIQHRKLGSAKDVASMRGFWSGALERLRLQLEV
jgi:hypothetical protein